MQGIQSQRDSKDAKPRNLRMFLGFRLSIFLFFHNIEDYLGPMTRTPGQGTTMHSRSFYLSLHI
eukprot:712953-Hanusia_phi.AAC.2